MSHTKRRHEPGSESSDLFTLASQILTKSLLTPSYTSFSAQNDTCKRHPATFYPLPHHILCAMHFAAFHDSTACVTTFLSARWGLLVSIILAFYFFLHQVDLKTMTLCHSPTYMYLYTCTILGWLNILPFSFNLLSFLVHSHLLWRQRGLLLTVFGYEFILLVIMILLSIQMLVL